jgi:hypothetical protein
MKFSLTLDAFAQLHKAPISFIMPVALSVRLPEYISAARTGRIFLKLHTEGFYKNALRESRFIENWRNYRLLYMNI